MTASVMNIPMETLMNKTQDSATPGWYKDKLIPNRIEYINDGTKEPKKIDCKATPDSCMNAEQVLGKAGGIYSPLLIYGYAIFKVQDIKTLDKWSDKINTPFQIAHQIIFGSLMFVVFGLLVLALVFMLIMRAIKLWFYAIFSPLMTLKYVIGDGVF